ncbi:flagellar M-ring protein FliF, partial [Actinoplanes sp. KI2]|nr:flagellar M-ring protein FliF [Actinoplanes sp. KI2]
ARRSKKRGALTAEERRHLEEMQAALEQQRLIELNEAIPTQMIESAPVDQSEIEARLERVREIRQMAKDQPDEMAILVRSWLTADATR